MGTLRSFVFGGILTLSLAAGAQAETSQHPASEHLVDLTADNWCHDCVVRVIDKYDIMSGFQDNTFRGDWTVNRYELAAAVARSFNKIYLSYRMDLPSPSEGKAKPIGVLPEHWAYTYVRKLAEEDDLLSKLFDQGKFQGNKKLTREELAYGLSEFLQKMEKSMNRKLDPERRESQLAIDLDVRSPYLNYIELALNRYQFMNLRSNHDFAPNAPVTRYELAAALCKVFDLFHLPEDKTAATP